jgi:site-specific DNA-methyltransferase (adenine-specific)
MIINQEPLAFGDEPIEVKQAKDLQYPGLDMLANYTAGFPSQSVGRSLLIRADAFEWLAALPRHGLHAIVTDPPYGVKEYEVDQLEKREVGVGGIWRIPPSYDGAKRAPLPRFTALNERERDRLFRYFVEFAEIARHALRPGGHLIIASNAFLSQLVFAALHRGGLEYRGEIIRLVQTLRGGDRPKNAEKEFPGVCSLPRGNYEPWGLFRAPMPNGMKVADCLRAFGTGGLRRRPDGSQFSDVIVSERTPRAEREIANHPSLKPQSFMRQVVHAALPLGEGIVADPFMGSGSTVAACEAIGYHGIGVERSLEYYTMACKVVPKLATVKMRVRKQLELPMDDLSLLTESDL